MCDILQLAFQGEDIYFFKFYSTKSGSKHTFLILTLGYLQKSGAAWNECKGEEVLKGRQEPDEK